MDDITSVEKFFALPRRVFLDSCTPQWLRDYGGFIRDGEAIADNDHLHATTEGYANIRALRDIFFVNQRALFEWVVSKASLSEAEDKGDAGHLQWAYDVLDHTLACLDASGGPTEESQALARRLEERRFDYLGKKDRLLIRDAVLLRCDGFLIVAASGPERQSYQAGTWSSHSQPRSVLGAADTVGTAVRLTRKLCLTKLWAP